MIKTLGAENALWITWERQVRNRSMSALLGAMLMEVDAPGSRLNRYSLCVIRTMPLLWRYRHKIVFAQNPSLVLSVVVLLLSRPLNYTFVMDAHNAGIFPAEGKRPLLRVIANWLLRRADLVLVTNQALADHVINVGGKPFVIPDPLPHLVNGESAVERSLSPTVLFICTWALDEPYLEVISAAEALPDVTFLITGSSKGKEKEFGRRLPPNAKLLGFVPQAEFEALLSKVHIVLDLTTRENCLLCGAYEAVAAGTPFVLSNTAALRSYFDCGGVHVDNQSSCIVSGIVTVLSDIERYRTEIQTLKRRLELSWTARKDSLVSLLCHHAMAKLP